MKKKMMLVALVVVGLIASVYVGGCGGSSSPSPVVVLYNLLYASGRALDSSDGVIASGTSNIWTIVSDGTGDTPLTSITAIGVISAKPQWSPDKTMIAFDSERNPDGSNSENTNGTSNIWVMNADGSGPTALTSLTADGAESTRPEWSPDGSKILYRSSRNIDGTNTINPNQVENVWVINADGTNDIALTSFNVVGTDSTQAKWSPDGSKIVFISTRDINGAPVANVNETSNVWVMNADGSSPTPLTDTTANGADSYLPVWSPNGTKIAFMSGRNPDGTDTASNAFNIWVVNADGSNATALTGLTAAGGVVCAAPQWSPDGSMIVFMSTRALDGSDAASTGPVYNIWTVSSDGSSATPLTSITAANAHSTFPVWLPDGEAIAFLSARALDGSDAVNTDNASNVWMIGADGLSAMPLTSLTVLGASCIDLSP